MVFNIFDLRISKLNSITVSKHENILLHYQQMGSFHPWIFFQMPNQVITTDTISSLQISQNMSLLVKPWSFSNKLADTWIKHLKRGHFTFTYQFTFIVSREKHDWACSESLLDQYIDSFTWKAQIEQMWFNVQNSFKENAWTPLIN